MRGRASYRRKQNIVIVPAKIASVVSEWLYLISGHVVNSSSAEVLLGDLGFFLQVQPRLINPLKNLRRLGLKLVAEFFSDHETYSFSVEEIDAVFHAVVWPQVCISCSSKRLMCNIYHAEDYSCTGVHCVSDVCHMIRVVPDRFWQSDVSVQDLFLDLCLVRSGIIKSQDKVEINLSE